MGDGEGQGDPPDDFVQKLAELQGIPPSFFDNDPADGPPEHVEEAAPLDRWQLIKDAMVGRVAGSGYAHATTSDGKAAACGAVNATDDDGPDFAWTGPPAEAKSRHLEPCTRCLRQRNFVFADPDTE